MELWYVEIREYQYGDIGDRGRVVECIGPFDMETAYKKAAKYRKQRIPFKSARAIRMPYVTRSNL